MATYDRGNLVLDLWLGILIVMATTVVVALALVIRSAV
jgi:hypothetical protein